MADEAQDRNLPASERKIRKARAEGQVARSRDLGHVTAVAAGGGMLVAAGSQLAGWMREFLARALAFDSGALASPDAMTEQLASLSLRALAVVLPFIALMAAVAVAASLLSGGWNWTFKPLMPKLGKLNPLAGLGRLFSMDQLTQTLKACALALVLGAIGFTYLRLQLPAFTASLTLPLPAALSNALHTVLGGLMLIVLALAAFAAVDLPLQRHLLAKRLRMSHQEVKQEHKEAEGSQEVKGRIKGRMREIARRRMLAAVPFADLVVMNPTHYAVALKYDDATMSAPRVVAKGANLLALRIRDLARDAKVPVLQAPPLARALYAHAEVDREIPAALFGAVAQVLAHVYQLRAALAGRAAMPAELSDLPVPDELDPHHGARPTADEDQA